MNAGVIVEFWLLRLHVAADGLQHAVGSGQTCLQVVNRQRVGHVQQQGVGGEHMSLVAHQHARLVHACLYAVGLHAGHARPLRLKRQIEGVAVG